MASLAKLAGVPLSIKSFGAATTACLRRSFSAQPVQNTEDKQARVFSGTSLQAPQDTKEPAKPAVVEDKSNNANNAGDQSDAPRKDGFQKLFF